VATVTGAVLAAAAAAFWPAPGPVEAVRPAGAASAGDMRLGPGAWTAAAAVSPPRQAAPQPPHAPRAGSDGRLAIDKALLQAFDFFLLGGLDGDRAQHAGMLRAYLKERLPVGAANEAIQLADRYLLYMNLHDDLLTRQSFPQWVDQPTAADAERIMTWITQRTRLRETVLGSELAQAWFGDEEAAIREGILEFELHSGIATQLASGEDGAQGAPADAQRDAAREVRREQFLRELAERSSRSYAAIEHERRRQAMRTARR